MKKFSYVITGIIIGYLSKAQAIAPPANLEANTVPTNLSTGITKVSNTILLVIGTLAVLMLIVGGFQYVTSAGSPDSVSKAKSTILYAIIGIIFAILAWAIVAFITSQLV